VYKVKLQIPVVQDSMSCTTGVWSFLSVYYNTHAYHECQHLWRLDSVLLFLWPAFQAPKCFQLIWWFFWTKKRIKKFESQYLDQIGYMQLIGLLPRPNSERSKAVWQHTIHCTGHCLIGSWSSQCYAWHVAVRHLARERRALHSKNGWES